jgi:hypothetical protein
LRLQVRALFRANVLFLAGIKNIAGASGFTLKRFRIYDGGRAVQADWSGSRNFYIADNVMIGRHDPDRMMGWTGEIWSKFPGYPELLLSEYVVKVYGQGNVVAYNPIANWHDGIDVATYGTPDGAPKDITDRAPMDIDFYNNDIYTWVTIALKQTAELETSEYSEIVVSTPRPER